MDIEKIAKHSKDMTINRTQWELYKLSSSYAKPKFKWLVFILLMIPSIIIAGLMSWSENTIKLLISFIETQITVYLALLGIIITGYSIFLALVQGKTLIKLMESQIKDRSEMQVYNLYFFGVSINYLTIILVNIIIKSILNTLDPFWSLSSSALLNTILAFILLLIYIYFSFYFILEFFSFIFNLHKSFNQNVLIKVFDEVEKEYSRTNRVIRKELTTLRKGRKIKTHRRHK